MADSTVVVPSMFAIYSGFGFSNSLFYLDNLDVYSKTITAMICLSLVVLLIGVGILSSKKVEGPLQKPRPDLEGTPGQEPEDEVAVARQRGGHHEDDDHGSAFGEGAKSKLQDAVNSIHFTRSPDHKSRKGAQLLSKGVDQREDEHEMQELPTLYSIDSKRPSDVGKSPFDDPENVFADPDPNRRRRGSFASLDSKDDGGDDFGGFVGAKDGR